MRLNIKKILGVVIALVGVVLILNSAGITGFAILEDVGRSVGNVLGIVFIIGGVLLCATQTLEHKVSKKKRIGGRHKRETGADVSFSSLGNTRTYFQRRAKEIFDPKYDVQDVWVSRWEMEGIINYMKKAKGNKGKKLYGHIEVEHKKEIPTIHTKATRRVKKSAREYVEKGEGLPRGVPYGIPHMNIGVEKNKGETVRRHFFITNNPRDEKLRYVGFNLKTGKREISKYNPNHPTPLTRKYQGGIQVTYDRGNIELGEIGIEITKTREKLDKLKLKNVPKSRIKELESEIKELEGQYKEKEKELK